jgi:hypothetical protein
MVEEPARFLAALKEASKGAMDPKLSEAENRCVKNLELIGNVALGLVRQLPQTLVLQLAEILEYKTSSDCAVRK